MHKNPKVTIESIVERIQINRLSISREQIFALIFMENREFTKVQQTIENQTRRAIKTSFRQNLIDELLVLDVKTRKKIEELDTGGQLEQELNDDTLPWQDNRDSWYNKINNSILPSTHKSSRQTKSYRRDNKDILATPLTPSKQLKLPNTAVVLHDRTKETSLLEPFSENIDTLTDEQMKQILKRGSLQGINAVLLNNIIQVTEGQRSQLQNQRKMLSPSPKLPERKNTINAHECTKMVRINQSAFRAKVLFEYGYQCAITGITITPILEAAHVIPADGNNDRVDNSLLLSKNMHGLFDLFLISINSDTNQLELAPSIRGKGLDYYQGKVIKHLVSKDNLQLHYIQFQAKIRTQNYTPKEQ